MIHCHCEPLVRLLPELPPLLQAHWDESEAALFGPQVYALDTERYACWERLGMLHVRIARQDDVEVLLCLRHKRLALHPDGLHAPSGKTSGRSGWSVSGTDRPQRPGRPEAAACGRGRAQGTRRGRGPVQFPGLPPL